MTGTARKTSFTRWRHEMGFTQEHAARALGRSLHWVRVMDAGHRYDTGEPALPDLVTRYAMAALAKRPPLEPWPAAQDSRE